MLEHGRDPALACISRRPTRRSTSTGSTCASPTAARGAGRRARRCRGRRESLRLRRHQRRRAAGRAARCRAARPRCSAPAAPRRRWCSRRVRPRRWRALARRWRDRLAGADRAGPCRPWRAARRGTATSRRTGSCCAGPTPQHAGRGAWQAATPPAAGRGGAPRRIAFVFSGNGAQWPGMAPQRAGRQRRLPRRAGGGRCGAGAAARLVAAARCSSAA